MTCPNMDSLWSMPICVWRSAWGCAELPSWEVGLTLRMLRKSSLRF